MVDNIAGSGAMVLLDAATATGTGGGKGAHPMINHTVTAKFVDVTGAVSALELNLEGSIDGVSWFGLLEVDHAFTAAELTAKEAMFHIANRVVYLVRANITTLTTSGTTTIRVLHYSGHGEDR